MKKLFHTYRWFLLLVLVLLLPLAYWYWPKNLNLTKVISSPVTLVDDWQYNLAPVPQYYYPPQPTTPLSWFKSQTPGSYLAVLADVFFLIQIPLALGYLIFRLFGFFVRLFRPQLIFGSRLEVFLNLLRLSASAIAAIWLSGLYSLTSSITNIVSTGIFVVFLISALLVSAYTLIYIIRRTRNLDLSGLKRHVLRSLALAIACFIFSVTMFLINVIFGINLMSYSLPSSGLANPTFGSVPTSMGGLKSFAPVDSIGFSVGGSKDINNFRENIKNKFLPLESAVTYEGLFYDYFFDSPPSKPCSDLFCPAYTYAVSPDPLTTKKDTYLSVGLNSGLQAGDFQRKKLNLVVILDISGSMGSPFDSYYYDRTSPNYSAESKAKIKVASESIVALLSHLQPSDRLGMVLFDQSSYLAKPLNLVGSTDMAKISQHILDLREQGSTNIETGYTQGTSLLEPFIGKNPDEYENRIIFLTDAQPNTGLLDKLGMAQLTKSNADRGIYTTFIGIGVDFNTQLIESLTKMKGANYYSVHSSADFSSRMDQGFDYMVTPLVFNLKLAVKSPNFTIENVYGSPEADLATGEIMKVNTLFPSQKTTAGVKGGLVLLQLKRTGVGPADIRITASYEDRNGRQVSNFQNALLPEDNATYYGNSGIRKGILLTRYASLLKNWISDARGLSQNQPVSQWERTSTPLEVSPAYKKLFASFNTYFVSESTVLDDPSLSQELDVLNLLLAN